MSSKLPGTRQGLIPLLSLCALLTAGTTVAQTVLTVGLDGAYPTIQSAIDEVVSGSDTEIRVEANQTYIENLSIGSGFAAGTLEITGGWDATFTSRSEDPSLTIVDGGAADSVVLAQLSGGSLLIEGFKITNGAALLRGGGIDVSPSGIGAARVTLRNSWLTENGVTGGSSAFGGAVHAQLDGTERLELVDCSITDNLTSAGESRGAGLYLSAFENASFLVQGNAFEDNRAIGTVPGLPTTGAGHSITTGDDTVGEFLDNAMVGNSSEGTADVRGSGGSFLVTESSSIVARRNLWVFNLDSTGAGATQLDAISHESGNLTLTDSVFALGSHGGLLAQASDTSVQRLTNLTVVDHPTTGLEVQQAHVGATLSLYNTIAFGNGTDTVLSGTVATGSNLVGIDPDFIDPTMFNYRLAAGSAALDAGDNAPPGGLGPSDADGNSRIAFGIVDVGAYERQETIFADGFESGDTSAWSSAVP